MRIRSRTGWMKVIGLNYLEEVVQRSLKIEYKLGLSFLGCLIRIQ
jgi:hypothetical protein